ncbi:MAG TPA: helix-turn-helix domain-containing protein [Candidatus Dormibacteraeota bacterium]|nr:helix-turn-helix domain-containing protein [Candidatus Dormibacteraeota bacterium]
MNEERERFLGGAGVSERVRPVIARSWLRSRESGVRPEGDPETRHVEFDPHARLLRLAQPVLDRLTDDIRDARASVILTDPRGLVLDRRAGSPSLLRGLDRVLLAPGYLYAEDAVGTNGIGTAAEDRGAALVVGSEHYAEWLRWLSCAGVPIRNPITGRIEGILDLTCRLEDTSPLMVPFVREGARQIERRLLEDASQDDRDLLERFMTVARRSSRPVIAVNAHTVISNTAAARLLDPADHAVLWNQIAEAMAVGTGQLREFRLAEGRVATLRPVSLEPDRPDRGAVLEIDLTPAAAVRSAPREQPSQPLPGRSLAWRRLCEAAAEHAEGRLPVLIVGESGTAKVAVARWMHQRSAAPGPVTVLDARLAIAGGAEPWLGQVAERLAGGPGMLVLRHLEALDAASARALAAMLAAADGSDGPRIVGTLTPPASGQPGLERALVDRFPAVIGIPALRDRPEDIADLVPALIRRLARGPWPRCTPEAVQVLMRGEWPGNVRQLETLLEGILQRRRNGELTLRDLPPEYQRGLWRRLSPMERAERAAILEALAQAGGNKSRAAAIAGISRVTLYRKLRELGIPDARATLS